jgi:hypothetical protein
MEEIPHEAQASSLTCQSVTIGIAMAALGSA